MCTQYRFQMLPIYIVREGIFLCHELELRVALLFCLSHSLTHEAWLNCKTNHVRMWERKEEKRTRERNCERKFSRWSSSSIDSHVPPHHYLLFSSPKPFEDLSHSHHRLICDAKDVPSFFSPLDSVHVCCCVYECAWCEVGFFRFFFFGGQTLAQLFGLLASWTQDSSIGCTYVDLLLILNRTADRCAIVRKF